MYNTRLHFYNLWLKSCFNFEFIAEHHAQEIYYWKLKCLLFLGQDLYENYLLQFKWLVIFTKYWMFMSWINIFHLPTYLHCQCASLKLYFRYDIMTDCIKDIFGYIIFWHLACYLRASSRMEFTQKYTTNRPFLSTTFVVLHFAIHCKQIIIN